jgi:hypothetical protein
MADIEAKKAKAFKDTSEAQESIIDSQIKAYGV